MEKTLVRNLIIFVCLLLMSVCHADYRYNLSICAIFQDEGPYLQEWIEYHRLVGVEHFYLYNHRSQDDYKKVLEPYIRSGIVELRDVLTVTHGIKDFNPLQSKCYTECAGYSKGASKWVAFLDIDEFLLPARGDSLPTLLAGFEEFGGLAVNWLMFGTSGIKQIPKNQLLIEALTSCNAKSSVLNRYIKTIARPERVSHFQNPHSPVYREGFFQVNTDKLPFEGPASTYIQTNKLRINHYWTRDEDYFYSKKVPRQQAWGGDPKPLELIDMMNTNSDRLIQRFVPLLKARLAEAITEGVVIP